MDWLDWGMVVSYIALALAIIIGLIVDDYRQEYKEYKK